MQNEHVQNVHVQNIHVNIFCVRVVLLSLMNKFKSTSDANIDKNRIKSIYFPQCYRNISKISQNR